MKKETIIKIDRNIVYNLHISIKHDTNTTQ